MDDKYEFLLRLPTYLHEVLVKYKEITGISVTSQIIDCIYRQMILRGFITVADIRNGIEFPKKEIQKQEIISQSMPEELKFCDGDKCEFDPIKDKQC